MTRSQPSSTGPRKPQETNGLRRLNLDPKLCLTAIVILLWGCMAIYSAISHQYIIMAVLTPVVTLTIAFFFGSNP